MNRELYFAYGSNLDQEQMRRRCPDFQREFVAKFAGHWLCFPRSSKNHGGGVASVEKRKHKDVWGIVYSLSNKDLCLLDCWEGFTVKRPLKDKRNSYFRKKVQVRDTNGTVRKVWTYFAIPQKPEKPSLSYKMLIVHGAEEHIDLGMPKEHISALGAIEVKPDGPDGVSPQWYEVNEEENAVDYLERAASFFLSSIQHKWKWTIIALHGALYSFSVCAVQGTDPSRVKEGDKLISIWKALDLCQDSGYMLQFSHSQVLSVTPDEKWAIQKLCDAFRNKFEHFSPTQWAIEVSGMPQIVRHISRVIEFLSLESGNVRLSGEQRQRTKQALEKLRS